MHASAPVDLDLSRLSSERLTSSTSRDWNAMDATGYATAGAAIPALAST